MEKFIQLQFSKILKMEKQFYYDAEKEITMEEAHALKDKSNLLVADKKQTFKKIKEVKE